MKDLKQFKLIDGIFTAQDANTVLTALINYKVDFHNREDFSNHIRFNKDLDHSSKRVAQLLESKNDLNSFFEQASQQNLKLKIQGTITITAED